MGDFSHHPLHGIGILVTRAKEQAAETISGLEALGASVFAVPAIRVEHLAHPPGLDESLMNIGTYDHLVFTSVNGVYSFLRHAGSSGPEPGKMPSALCVGPKTAEAWRQAGGTVKAVPGKYSAADLVDVLGDDLDTFSLLILRPEHVKTNLAQQLQMRGARVDEIILYRTIAGEEDSESLEVLLKNEKVDVILFASPSAIYGILSMAGGPERIRDLLAVCIGPTTAKAAVDSGMERVVFPEHYTSEGMIQVLLARAEEIRDRR